MNYRKILRQLIAKGREITAGIQWGDVINAQIAKWITKSGRLYNKLVDIILKKKRKITKQEWVATVANILIHEPYWWTEDEAEGYGETLLEGYYEDDYSPEDALAEDQTYWD